MTTVTKKRRNKKTMTEAVQQKAIIRKMVKVGDLKDATYNPKNRTSEEKTRKLQASMEKHGMFNPIVVTPAGVVIEGHRRLACAKRLGWLEVECSISEGSPEEVYSSINYSMRKLSGNDALGVWLKEPKAVDAMVDKRFSKMQETIGRVLVKKIYESGCTSRIYDTAVMIARGCDSTDSETIHDIAAWLLEFGAIGQIMRAMTGGVNPRKILKAVKEKKPITLKMDVL